MSGLANLRPTCRRMGLSMIHAITLEAISAKGRMHMSELAEQAEISTAAATGIVDAMEIRRLVLRHRCPIDRRKVWVEMTPRGREVLDQIQASIGPEAGSDGADELAEEGLLAG